MRRALVAALLLTLVGGGVCAVLRSATWRMEKIHSGFEPEAIRNPMLGAVLMLGTMGRTAVFQKGLPPDTAALDPSDTLLMFDRGHGFSPRQARRLAAFVERGGLLVLETDEASASAARQRAMQDKGELAFAEPSLALRDPLMERLGVQVIGVRPHEPSKAGGKEPGDPDKSDDGPVLADATASAELQWHENEAPFLVDTDPGIRLFDRRHRASMTQKDPMGLPMLRYELGKGQVFVFTDLDGFTNRRIAKRDHAELLWELVKERPASARIWLLQGDPPAGLASWLVQHAWMALLSLVALVAVVFWKAASRSGPLLPEPDPARRSLLEHVDASGRLLWQEGAGDRLVKATRAALLSCIERTHPAWARLPLPQLHTRLTEFSHLPDQHLFRALFEDHYASPAEFTAAIRTLEHLRKLL